jgi:hypothetical protein
VSKGPATHPDSLPGHLSREAVLSDRYPAHRLRGLEKESLGAKLLLVLLPTCAVTVLLLGVRQARYTLHVQPVWAFAASIVVTIVTAWITSRVTTSFALKRFYQEKSWERKVNAYESALTALFQMRLYAEINLSAVQGAQEVTTERGAELLTSWQKGHDDLRRVATIGTLLLSDLAATAIQNLVEELDDADQTTNAFEYYDLRVAAVKACILTVREAAKQDIPLK